MKIVFIGAGNLATHLAKSLYNNSFNITQVYSRTLASAQKLASEINATFTDKLDEIVPNADIYIFSIPDSVLESTISKIKVDKNKLFLHTAGSMPLDVFKDYSSRYGVIYPFQTFSKQKEIDFSSTPVFIEANNENDRVLLTEIVNSVTHKVYYLPSEKRQYLHLTGVFACNFTNHMYSIANQILSKEDIPFDVILPLIDETANKVHSLAPEKAQTGPAIRYDENVINKHLSLILDEKTKDIYKLLSESIHKINYKK